MYKPLTLICTTHNNQRRIAMLQKITPSLWFDSNAKEAAEFYAS